MTENRPTEWQWRDVDNDERVDGLTRAEWRERGVVSWARDNGHEVIVSPTALGMRNFCERYRYAPATAEMMPAAWPAKMDWQWRKLDADMDERTWQAITRWRYSEDDHAKIRWRWEEEYGPTVAKAGEWWAPADQDGNPCEWPELEPAGEATAGEEACPKCGYKPWMDCDPAPCAGQREPQPVVVIPAAEMTALVFYGHMAIGGKWRWRTDGTGWIAAGTDDNWCEDDDGERWTPCDEHFDFCELRRVESEGLAKNAVKTAQGERDLYLSQYREWRDRALRLNKLLQGLGDQAEQAWKGRSL